MNFDKPWTAFALDAEVDAFGTVRIAKAHNALREAAADVLALIARYGGNDGGHHKQWVLDQVVRLLAGPDGYAEWLAEYADGEDGPHTYSWDVGVPS